MEYGDMSDRSLLRAGRKGDNVALEALIARYQRPLYTFLLRMVGPSGADDLFQETWRRAIKAIDRFDDRNLLGWLFRIARNLAVDRSRRESRWVPLEDGVRDPPYRSPTAAPDHAMANRELEERIRAAVAELPVEQREVFLLRMEGNLPFREIASIQGVSINTALARMQYALQKLRVALAEFRPSEGGDSHEHVS